MSAAPRAATSTARRDFPYAPYDDSAFEVPVFTAGDVDARVWVRIREIEQSIASAPALARQSAVRADARRAPIEGAGEGIAMTEAFRGDVLVWVRVVDGRIARCHARDASWFQWPLLGGRDREQHRRRLPALQQVVQLLVFGARSLMRTLLLKSLFARPVTVPAPRPDAVTPPDRGRDPGRAWQGAGGEARRLFGRSITIREVDAGSCNGCELEIHALNNAVYDVERFGIKFAASPRHADVLLVTGPVTHNMRVALERTYAATPDPKWVVAVGDCAAGCGVFAESYATVGSVGKVVPVDLVIKGCPPKPIDLVKGLLALMEQATAKTKAAR